MIGRLAQSAQADLTNFTSGDGLERAVPGLENRTIFEGGSFGAPVQRTGEVVFNSAITHQEFGVLMGERGS